MMKSSCFPKTAPDYMSSSTASIRTQPPAFKICIGGPFFGCVGDVKSPSVCNSPGLSLENRTISSSLLALLSGVPVALFLLPSTLKNLKRTIIHKRKRGRRKKKRTRKKKKRQNKAEKREQPRAQVSQARAPVPSSNWRKARTAGLG